MTPVKETVRELVAQELETLLFPNRTALAKERKGATVRVLGDLCWGHTAGNPEEAQPVWAELRKRWEKACPELAGSWEKDLGSLLCFLRYPWQSAHIFGAQSFSWFIPKERRGTKVRDHQFPGAEVVEKLLYLDCERQEGPWELRLQGLVEAQEGREKSFLGRHPRPQTLTHASWSPCL